MMSHLSIDRDASIHRLLERMTTYGRMVRFSHTVFALPFALSAVVLALRQHAVHPSDVFWILVAMAGARTAAMGFNRLADAAIDAANPRTSHREIPAGRLSIAATTRFVIFFSALFLLACAMLGRLCFYLSLPVIVVLFAYSYTKRFTWLSHLYLGFAISLAPVGAWIGITKGFSWPILLLSGALMTWMAGFDILYACQDIEFDRHQGLFSIPVRFGIKTALALAGFLHVTSFFFFLTIYFIFQMNWVYLITVLTIGMLLCVEHHLIRPDDLSHVNVAFFHINSVISIVLFLGILMDEAVRRWA